MDALSVFADWDGSGDPDEIPQSAWVLNGDGSFSFTHVYMAASPSGGYAASILLQDEGGQGTTVPVSVVVNKMPLTGTLVAGIQVASSGGVGVPASAAASRCLERNSCMNLGAGAPPGQRCEGVPVAASGMTTREGGPESTRTGTLFSTLAMRAEIAGQARFLGTGLQDSPFQAPAEHV